MPVPPEEGWFVGVVLAEPRALPGVERVQVDTQGYAELHTLMPEALLAELFGQGQALSELEVTRATLEDAFLHLTGPPSLSA